MPLLEFLHISESNIAQSYKDHEGDESHARCAVDDDRDQKGVLSIVLEVVITGDLVCATLAFDTAMEATQPLVSAKLGVRADDGVVVDTVVSPVRSDTVEVFVTTPSPVFSKFIPAKCSRQSVFGSKALWNFNLRQQLIGKVFLNVRG